MDDSALSHWGWGLRERFSSRDDRRDLADLVEGVLGFPEREVREPAALDDLDVPSPAVEPPGDVATFATTAAEPRIRHTYGRNYEDLIRGFRGEYDHPPDVVARPPDEEAVRAVLDWAADQGVAVVPYGGGTSVVGGVEPSASSREDYAGVVSLDCRGLDAVHEVDDASRTARLGAGLLGPELNERLGEHGYQIRHYPQSYEFSTLGGWLATRAGGHFATVYTRIDDFVERVRMLAPDGTVDTNEVPATGAGPDPEALVLGSEGALGVITEATMRVQPRPSHRAKATVTFEDFKDGVAACRAIAQARLYPANCRLLDGDEALIAQVSMTGESVLFLGFESTDHGVERDLDRALAICDEHGGSWDGREVTTPESGGADDSVDDAESSSWRSSFLDAPYRFNDLVSIGVVVDTFETCTTWSKFPDLHDRIQREVTEAMEEVCGDGFLSTRFTHVYEDGPAPYYTFLAPAEAGREVAQWRAIKEAAYDAVLDGGGTITHHHSVGRLHRDWYGREVGDDYLEALRGAKQRLDPEGVMNPGALLPPGE